MRGALIFAAAALTRIAVAQETINYGSIGGLVTDASGAVVEGAHVSARQVETNLKNLQDTGHDGRFRFPYLHVGSYEITVSHEGFAQSRRTVSITIGSAFDLPITLAVQSTETNVTVLGEATVLEAARTQIAGTVSQTEARSLPLNGRNFLNLALLVPGVSPTNTASNQLFAETSAVPGQGISIGSQRNFSNNFIVDGLSANDDAAGLSGIFYGLDVVDEFQVVTSGGQAEFGRALGGYVSVVTKRGTNTLHGDVYGYFRNSRFNAANALSHTALPLTQAQYGASLGGPVIRDRTFFFANFERRDLNQSGLITIAPANVAAINARLSELGYPGSPIYTGLYPNPVHNTNFLGKLDHQFNARDQFNLRYSLYDVHSANSRGAGGISAASASAGLENTDRTLAAGNIATFSPRLVNETRAQFTGGNLQAPPSDPVGPAVSIAGVASLGTLSGSPTARVNNLYEIADNLSWQVGSHALRAGADFLYNGDTITFPRSIRGSYSFASLAGFLAGTYNNSGFTQTFNTSVVSQTNPNTGFYVQDEWKPNSHLTLNLGLRYDLQFLETISTDPDNVSPRAGFAWSPFASRDTVIRGSFGLFYDRLPLRALANALLSAGNTIDPASLRQISVSLSPTQTGAPVDPPQPDPAAWSSIQLQHHGSPHPERLLRAGQPGNRAARRPAQHTEHGLSTPARTAPHRIGQPERACLRGFRQQQRLPAQSRLRQRQPVFFAGRFALRRPACLLRPAAVEMGQLPHLLLLVESARQCRRVLLQFADRQLRYLARLWPLRRRPAPPRGFQRQPAFLVR